MKILFYEIRHLVLIGMDHLTIKPLFLCVSSLSWRFDILAFRFVLQRIKIRIFQKTISQLSPIKLLSVLDVVIASAILLRNARKFDIFIARSSNVTLFVRKSHNCQKAMKSIF